MTNLEFINEKIKETKRSIRTWEMLLKNKPNDEVLAKCLNIREKELQSFQQIKNELEAWKIIKNALELTTNELGEEEIEMKVFFTNAKVELNDTRKEFKIIKEALEVE